VTEAAIAVFMTLGKWIITQRVPTILAFMKHATHLVMGPRGGLLLGHIQNITSVGRLFDFLNNPRF